jgi:hypothetical protein
MPLTIEGSPVREPILPRVAILLPEVPVALLPEVPVASPTGPTQSAVVKGQIQP